MCNLVTNLPRKVCQTRGTFLDSTSKLASKSTIELAMVHGESTCHNVTAIELAASGINPTQVQEIHPSIFLGSLMRIRLVALTLDTLFQVNVSFFGKSLISWRTKKQFTVSRSSSDAEYRALSFKTYKFLYLHQDLQISCVKPPVLYCHNLSAIHIAANPVFHECTKHLEIDYHIVHEKLRAGLMKLLSMSSQDQIADFFTKPLLPQPFQFLLSKLNMLDIYHSSPCGGLLQSADENTKETHNSLQHKLTS
jgi:hypothetical protein